MKLLKTSDELISHMKIKGIKFDIAKEEDAKVFLQNNNYYMKLASYRANYDKQKSNDKYINLDFAYLQELSTIDMHLRYLILQMCLDVEHALKTRLLKDIEDNPEEDGYDIIRRFVTKYERSCQNIQKHKSSEYCRELIEKYYPYFPACFNLSWLNTNRNVTIYSPFRLFYLHICSLHNMIHGILLSHSFLSSSRILSIAALILSVCNGSNSSSILQTSYFCMISLPEMPYKKCQ